MLAGDSVLFVAKVGASAHIGCENSVLHVAKVGFLPILPGETLSYMWKR